jgi:hypothetical protein
LTTTRNSLACGDRPVDFERGREPTPTPTRTGIAARLRGRAHIAGRCSQHAYAQRERRSCRPFPVCPAGWFSAAESVDFRGAGSMMIAVEQDGLRTDERLVVGRLERLESTRPTSRIVLRTMVVAAVRLMLAIGTLFGRFWSGQPDSYLPDCAGRWLAVFVLALAVARSGGAAAIAQCPTLGSGPSQTLNLRLCERSAGGRARVAGNAVPRICQIRVPTGAACPCDRQATRCRSGDCRHCLETGQAVATRGRVSPAHPEAPSQTNARWLSYTRPALLKRRTTRSRNGTRARHSASG